MTLDQAIRGFIETLREQEKSDKTIQNYQADLVRLKEFLNDDITAGERGPGALPAARIPFKKYAQRLKTSGLAIATVNRRIATLKSFATYLHQIGELDVNPAPTVKAKKQQRQNETRWLTRDEITKLFETIPKINRFPKQQIRTKAILTVLVNCGLRVSELCDLRFGDIDFENGVIHVQNGKGEKYRRVPLGKTTIETLQRYCNQYKTGDNKYFVTGPKGERITSRSVQRLLERLSNESNVKATPHTLRHTFAKQIADKTSKLEVIADLCGHSSIETSRQYVTPSTNELQKVVENIEFKS